MWNVHLNAKHKNKKLKTILVTVGLESGNFHLLESLTYWFPNSESLRVVSNILYQFK